MVEDVGRIATGGLLVGFPDEELVEHYLVAGNLAVDATVQKGAGRHLAAKALDLLEGAEVGELADADVGLGRGLVGPLPDEAEAEETNTEETNNYKKLDEILGALMKTCNEAGISIITAIQKAKDEDK